MATPVNEGPVSTVATVIGITLSIRIESGAVLIVQSSPFASLVLLSNPIWLVAFTTCCSGGSTAATPNSPAICCLTGCGGGRNAISKSAQVRVLSSGSGPSPNGMVKEMMYQLTCTFPCTGGPSSASEAPSDADSRMWTPATSTSNATPTLMLMSA